MNKIIIANWKMNPGSLKEAGKLFSTIAKSISRIKKTKVVVCAPFIYLERLQKFSRKIALGAQDTFYGGVGPYTGQISPEMLYNARVKYVILGHSERRAIGETNEFVNKKLKGALSAGLTPILCIGETRRDENHKYFGIVQSQLLECINGISKSLISKIIFVYEPVWAISSTANRHDASSDDSREMTVFIRKVLSNFSSPEIAGKVKILYGGSVNERDADDFMHNGGVEGLLVGRASLDAKKFAEIIKICEALKN